MGEKQRRAKHSYNSDNDELEKPKNNKKTKKKKKKRHIFLKLVIILFVIIAILLGILAGFAYDKYNKISYDNIDKNEIQVNEEVVQATGYRNIYLFGVDSRNNDYKSTLSDVIMVISINQDTKKVKIASVYRDTYLQMTDGSFDKVTHAFGKGPATSMSVLNTNLDLDITEYVAINFNVVVDVVDSVGGVTMEITNEEAGYINPYIDEVNKVTGHNSKHITKGGTYTLDGVQATAYARIRYTSGGDWTRTERQRKVLNLVFEKAKKMNLVQLNKLADNILKEVSTNIKPTDIFYLLSQAMSYEIEDTVGWPYDVADYQPAKVWYGAPVNLENQVIKLHEFLFDREEYQVSSKVKTISDAIIRKTGIK